MTEIDDMKNDFLNKIVLFLIYLLTNMFRCAIISTEVREREYIKNERKSKTYSDHA